MSILHTVFVSEHLNHEIRLFIPKNVKTTKTHRYKKISQKGHYLEAAK